jgi:hypothetical protein
MPPNRDNLTTNEVRAYGVLQIACDAMNRRPSKAPVTAAALGALLLAPSSAYAATGVTVEGALLTLLVVGVGFWAAFVTLAPLRRSLRRIPREPSRLGLFVMGAAALAFGAGSILVGKTTIGAGVVIEALEPLWFWNLVKLQLGAGAVLVVLGLFAGGRSR